MTQKKSECIQSMAELTMQSIMKRIPQDVLADWDVVGFGYVFKRQEYYDEVTKKVETWKLDNHSQFLAFMMRHRNEQ